ncbi:MAG TPA: GAF domain-containing protein [Kofleriaceae bacterium]|nr:GAF domain-containing protein [Kofleriaceae bacterium]
MGQESIQPAESELEHKLRTEQKKLALVQEIGRALSSALDLDELLGLIMEKVTLLMEADRSTLFLVSEDGHALWSKITQGSAKLEIRLNVGEGIAGWVAKSGDTVNIPDAYIDKRFQPAVDLRSGYRTRSILCTPMRDSKGVIIGVLQVLNKAGGPFTGEDEELLAALAGQAAVSVENSKLYHSVVAKNVELLDAQEALEQKTHELNILYEIEREMNAAHDLDELLARILDKAMDAVEAKAGSIALREPGGDELRFRTVGGPVASRMLHRTIRMGEGVIGWVAANRTAVIVNDPDHDARHHTEFAVSVGLRPRQLAAAPLASGDEVLGAIELIDKRDPDAPDGPTSAAGFSEGDLVLLTLIAGQASRAIQLAKTRGERENQNRLASIGQMLASVLHDLKTPMTIISGYAQLMAQMQDARQREQYVDQILRQFDLMSGMTREVLAFARGETNVLLRKVYLHRFLDEVMTQLEHALAGRNIALGLDAAYTGVAYFDEQAMLRLVHNLARNAAEAMPRGGEFRISTQADGERLILEFADSGPGIPPELEGRLFELFATAKPGGTGLGLAICKKIVDEHGGDISCESVPGQGTTFRVALPMGRPANMPNTGEHPVLGRP